MAQSPPILFLTTPRIFFVLEQSWTEPFVVFGLAASSSSRPVTRGSYRGCSACFVGAEAVSRSGDSGGALAGFAIRARCSAFYGRASIAGGRGGAAVRPVEPIGILEERRRASVLSAVPAGRVELSVMVDLARASAAVGGRLVRRGGNCSRAVSLWRLPRTPAGFAAAVALTFFAFFAFNKQAFCNYYFFGHRRVRRHARCVRSAGGELTHLQVGPLS